MKRYILSALLISAITAAGLSAGEGEQWNRRNASVKYQKPLSKNQPKKTAKQLQQEARIQRQARTRQYTDDYGARSQERARQVQQVKYADALAREEGRQRAQRFLSTDVTPEAGDFLRKDMRKDPAFSTLESPGRHIEYPVALAREGRAGQSFDYDSPGLVKRRGLVKMGDLAAYDLMEPNAPAPQPWIDTPEVMGARRRPLYEQLPYMPQEYVTPEVGEAYEQMLPSKVHAYEMPQYVQPTMWNRAKSAWNRYWYKPQPTIIQDEGRANRSITRLRSYPRGRFTTLRQPTMPRRQPTIIMNEEDMSE